PRPLPARVPSAARAPHDLSLAPALDRGRGSFAAFTAFARAASAGDDRGADGSWRRGRVSRRLAGPRSHPPRARGRLPGATKLPGSGRLAAAHHGPEQSAAEGIAGVDRETGA